MVERVAVVAAAVVRDGRVLAARRMRPRPGWEFPGGKVEPGELPAAALARECAEELAITVRARRRLGRADDGRVEIELWLAELLAGEPVLGDDHDALRWLDAATLDEPDWLPLDRALLAALRPYLL